MIADYDHIALATGNYLTKFEVTNNYYGPKMCIFSYSNIVYRKNVTCLQCGEVHIE